MRELRRVAGGVALATLALAIVLAAGPISTRQTLSGYVLVLAGLALASLVRVASARSEWEERPAFDEALRPRRDAPARPPELARIEREITLGIATAGRLEARLVPLLRDAAATRLAAAHNVDLEQRPDAARRLLGDESWELLRPDRGRAREPTAPGLPLARIRAVVDALERL